MECGFSQSTKTSKIQNVHYVSNRKKEVRGAFEKWNGEKPKLKPNTKKKNEKKNEKHTSVWSSSGMVVVDDDADDERDERN